MLFRPTPHKRQPSAPAPVRLAPRYALHDPAELLRSGPSSMPRRWPYLIARKNHALEHLANLRQAPHLQSLQQLVGFEDPLP